MHLPNHNPPARNLRKVGFMLSRVERENQRKKTYFLKMVTTNEFLHTFLALTPIKR